MKKINLTSKNMYFLSGLLFSLAFVVSFAFPLPPLPPEVVLPPATAMDNIIDSVLFIFPVAGVLLFLLGVASKD